MIIISDNNQILNLKKMKFTSMNFFLVLNTNRQIEKNLRERYFHVVELIHATYIIFSYL